ncbi:ShlB/FhaC/HecB family hemolysin secretion/activation protein [Sphingomonas asaccharolytica]|uniref:ShlB/FhaC/HecB family hemolysin secretion/activation protein n=1 Tax=Sphingomonas asaccharolytica TaxID=40681 RepID=UPI000B168321|nr:ShlB/FhaC/HecB family hemolysin secretion/activation protein [Sphingomonas asaccharolytica]
MTYRILAGGWLAVVAFLAQPACAQSALDRVAPSTRQPDSAPEPTPPPPDFGIVPGTPIESPAVRGEILVGAISLSGLTALTPEQFSDVLGDYVGRTLQPADLAMLTDRIAGRARDRGYVFASARIAPQRLAAGVLVVEVDEGRIDRIDLEGSDNAAVRAALAPLADGKPVTLNELQRHLLIAGDIDGIRIRQTRLVHDGNRGVLVVRVAQDSASLRVAIRNDGTRPVGPVEIHIEAMISQLVFADDALSVAYSSALFEPKELQYARLRYQKRLNSGGTELSLASSWSSVQPGSYLSGYEILGRSWSQSIGLLQPLHRRRRSSIWLTASLEVNNLTQRRGGRDVRRDRETLLRAGLYGYDDLFGGRLRFNALVSQGLDLFDATDPGDPLASRSDADGTFTSANLWLEWTRTFGSGFSIRLAGNGQIASQPLLIGEEVALGGRSFLRGYDWSERSGDEGAMGSAELRYDVKQPLGIVDRAQFYAFGDGGVVRNLSNGTGGGSLASAGGGLRVDISHAIGATAEVAVPLTGPRYDTGNRQPRINLGLSTAF